ncbi:DUF1822 family protein [Geminocystis herdmanii]|uniref:DUF1822 family protein n=1 Tax=Geminocystis herdmanii TaxID=669359 RepID=UPI0003483FD4|nr:DUF1822 family protein [Geminocystis herdmanii]
MTNLSFIDTSIDEIKIQLTDKIKTETWQQTNKLSNEISRFRGYLNLLVRKTFLSWLNLMLDSNFVDNISLEDNLSIWEFTNGNATDIDSSRIVLIPVETQDKTEFSIPEEWLKIPSWVGNYYLPVEVNLEENYLSFWGYTSYQDVLNYGNLDSFNHCVDFPFESLETDLNLICLEYEYGWNSLPQISPLPVLSTIKQQSLIQEIQNYSSPRLLLNFEQWLSLISDNITRHQLFSSRQGVNLNIWLNRQFSSALTKGWQCLDDLQQQFSIPDFSLTPAFSARSISRIDYVKILQENLDEDRFDRAVPFQDRTAINNIFKSIINQGIEDNLKPEIIKILPSFIDKKEDEETRWNAVLALQTLDANHPACAIWQGKIINLETENIALLIGILPKFDQQIDIFIRIYNLSNNSYLPNDLQLQIIDDNNDIFEEINTNNNDAIIQYKFWGNYGESFTLKFRLNDYEKDEYFTI